MSSTNSPDRSNSSPPTSLQLIDKIIAYVQSSPTSVPSSTSSSSSASTSSSLRPSTTSDVAWFPEVPVGHTAYTWYGEESVNHSNPQLHSQQAPQAHSAHPAHPQSIQPAQPANPSSAVAGNKPPVGWKAAIEQKTNAASKVAAANVKKAAAKPASAAGTDAVDPNQPDFSHLDIRVGQIVSAARHPDPSVESLYVEQIDVGEEKPREVVSGLVKFVPLEEFSKARVLVICNLKPSNLKGVTSHGMVLAAKSADGATVELITPPVSAAVGERIGIGGLNIDDYSPDASVDPKKKGNVWSKVAETLRVDGEGVATWDGKPLTTKTGACKSKSLKNAVIS